MSVITFDIALKEKVSAPAKTAAMGMQRAADQAKLLTTAMLSIEKQATKAAALGDIGKMQKLTKQYEAFGSSLKVLESEFPGVTSSMEKQATATTEAGTSMSSMAGDALDAIDPLTLIAAAATAAIGTFVALSFEGAKLAVEMTELHERTLETLGALAGGDRAGAATLGMLDAMRSKLGLTRAQLLPMSEELMAMGYQGKGLQEQLTALASVKAIGVDGGEAEYSKILKEVSSSAKVASGALTNLYKTGVSVDDISAQMGISTKQLRAGLKGGTIDSKKFADALTNAVTQRGAGALAAQAGELGAQWDILKENFKDMFVVPKEDLEPFVAGLKDLASIFGKNTASGKTLSTAIHGGLTLILQTATKVLPYIKLGLEYIVIGALKAYIAIKKFFSGEQGIERLHAAMAVLALVVGVVVVAIGAVAAIVAFNVAVFAAFVAGVLEAISILHQLDDMATTVAVNFINGLIKGIKDGVGLVKNEIGNLGDSMVTTIKDKLGIHSPSKVMMELGGYTAEGFAQGISAGSGDVSGAATGLTATTAGAAGEGATNNTSSSRSLVVNVEPGAIVIGGTAGKTDTELTETALSLLIERISLEQGL